MTLINDEMTREEVGALVCSTFERNGIEVVLSGGAVVSIYTENEYESYDLDFIRTGLSRRVDPFMLELGFHKEGRYWKHPNSKYWIEFPPGPVQVGEAFVSTFANRKTKYGELRLLTPTDCVLDRLAGYFHWNDPQSLEQALSVARHQSVDLERIESWSERERSIKGFRIFKERLAQDR